MKVLLDKCLPLDLRHLVSGHSIFTVAYMGWKGIKNGRLLALAGADGFDAMVTTDGGTEHQQNPATLPVTVVVLDAPSNDIDDLRPLVPELIALLPSIPPRTFFHIPVKHP